MRVVVVRIVVGPQPASAGPCTLPSSPPGRSFQSNESVGALCSLTYPTLRDLHHRPYSSSSSAPLSPPTLRLPGTPLLHSTAADARCRSTCGICPFISPSFLNLGCTGSHPSRHPAPSPYDGRPPRQLHVYCTRPPQRPPGFSTALAICVLTCVASSSNPVSTLCLERVCFVSIPQCPPS